ncbi:hypothetical protein OZ410_00585 [Robiginitalea sp. M366]|uniref:hypothetical protein n=1 Tax=Robiginitalea aestuariiviva TaxID=3036903 RepID=UPI00240DB41C|nr:hypothetical protein [Robiginitalea aestuariiviva]MDG1570793.1 hypothetical protein [Robiginitalea aestuariiviva]
MVLMELMVLSDPRAPKEIPEHKALLALTVLWDPRDPKAIPEHKVRKDPPDPPERMVLLARRGPLDLQELMVPMVLLDPRAHKE